MTVILAFLANILVAIAKTVAAIITSSASMVAEAAHSWADAGNEVFLLIADRRGAKAKDARHPLGYGRNAFVWSLIAAFGIFTAGSIVSIMHGIQELSDTGPVESPTVAYIVLGVSFVLEGASFTQAMVKSRRLAKERGSSTWDFVLETSDTTLRAVFFEDSAALIGLVLAGGAILLHQITGVAAWDAIGSILVGVLLGVVAIILIRRNIAFLVGATAAPELRARVGSALLGLPQVERVTYLHIEYVGPNRLFIVAEVDLAGDAREHDVARQLRDLEQRIEQHDAVETAVLSLSVDDEPSVGFASA
ncbi:cation diffusion facilitator family transporter [Microbacterium oxydans]|uniref:cation diffusion facilitator family transporter n=1 Tax=Microbacterium TaxID=33882 RepID=UPI000734AF17|nr:MULTISPECIES: cation diffusion facilitator family transporter [Microbacterium]KAB1893016.1 cation diffusion facilitator family transporter [Microbacterium oxydans]KTR78736.1 cation diffusion facilitator family transporter [Microbacterium oxydans]MBE7952928.1 cation diffusion facilitator family transporter [Microbacterium sp. R1]GED37444.1 cation diffusion facilitator transporter [Microbacterium oxydans]